MCIRDSRGLRGPAGRGVPQGPHQPQEHQEIRRVPVSYTHLDVYKRQVVKLFSLLQGDPKARVSADTEGQHTSACVFHLVGDLYPVVNQFIDNVQGEGKGILFPGFPVIGELQDQSIGLGTKAGKVLMGRKAVDAHGVYPVSYTHLVPADRPALHRLR